MPTSAIQDNMSAISSDNQKNTEKSSLVNPQQVFQEKIKYFCKQCDFETNKKSSLYTHRQAIHVMICNTRFSRKTW